MSTVAIARCVRCARHHRQHREATSSIVIAINSIQFNSIQFNSCVVSYPERDVPTKVDKVRIVVVDSRRR
jgi:hypothetical protein